MSDTSDQNDPAIEEMLKGAITCYMLDRLNVENRLKAVVQQIAVDLLAEEVAALRAKAAIARASYLPSADISTPQAALIGEAAQGGGMISAKQFYPASGGPIQTLSGTAGMLFTSPSSIPCRTFSVSSSS
ncbi:hypothetical protein [Rhizobium pisi]